MGGQLPRRTSQRWLEDQLRASAKTVLFISHDRELLDRVATLEPGVASSRLWVHPGRFSTCHQARVDRNSRLEELRCHWDGEHSTLTVLVFTYKNKSTFSDGLVSRLHAAQTPLAKFVAARPPELVRQVRDVKLTSSRP